MRAHTDPIQRCFAAMNRANRQDGETEMQTGVAYFIVLPTKADSRLHILIPFDGCWLAHFVYRRRGDRLFRLGDGLQMNGSGISMYDTRVAG
jgi:hypothetical protein